LWQRSFSKINEDKEGTIVKIVKSDEKAVNKQIDGFNISITPKSVGNVVEQAIEYRKQKVWGVSDGVVDYELLPYKDELSAIADDLHDNNRRVALLVDVDVDGYMSSTIIYKALKDINNKLDIDVLLPDMKLHGIKENIDLVTKDYDYLFLPDSSSNDLHTIAQLENNRKTKVVVIDHHILSQEAYLLDNPGKFLIVSNQYQDSKLDKELTGAGMTLLVAKLWGQKYDIEFNYDLAAIGQIADMSNLNGTGVYGIVQKGLSEMRNEMLVEFFKDDPEVRSIKHIQFTLIPRINAVSRIGSPEERKLIFNALIDRGEEKPVKIRKKGGDGKMHTQKVNMNVYERAKRMLTKVKGRQDRLVKKSLGSVEWLTNSDDNFSAVILPKEYDRGIAGLTANKILGNTKQPALVLKHNGNHYDGSGRFPETINGLRLLGNINEVFTGGHEMAFGISFPTDKFDEVSKVIETAAEQAPDYVYQVDGAFVNELPSVKDIREIYQNSVKFRGAKDEIKIAVLGLRVDKRNIALKNNWTKIQAGNITINDFNTSESLKRYINTGFGDKCFSFIANAGFNFWSGRAIPTLVVEKMVPSDGVEVVVSKDNFVF